MRRYLSIGLIISL